MKEKAHMKHSGKEIITLVAGFILIIVWLYLLKEILFGVLTLWVWGFLLYHGLVVQWKKE